MCKPAHVHFCVCIFVCINIISYDQYHKKGHGASSMNGAVLNIGLIGQVIGWFDWHFHSLHCEKRSQIRCVWGDYYESECPPKRERRRERGHKRWKQSKEPRAVLCNVSIDSVKLTINTYGALAHTHTHQTPLTQRVERARGMISDPCCMKPPTGNHRLFPSVYWFSSRSLRSRRHGWGLYHSYGLNLTNTQRQI